MSKRIVIIGLDGADWRLLGPWIEQGDLPTLARLVGAGAAGKLRSTIRPESSVAWSSFSTGVNPGKHGVFGFVERVEGGYSFKLANGSSVRARRFWDVLGERGLKVGLLNVPFTYPPSPVNGFVVAGMLTPGPETAFVYPRELQRRLLARFGNYLFDAGGLTGDRSALIERVRTHTRQQRETSVWLLQEQQWDLFVMVFTGPDRLQHFLWAGEDGRHALLDHYRDLDDAIAGILGLLPADTLVLLMSDHGFNGCARRFYVNHWLIGQGLLALNESGSRWGGLTTLFSRLGSVERLRRLKRAIFPSRWDSVALRSRAFERAIDWSRTQVYFGMDGGLRVNLRGREPEGIVPPEEYDALRQGLRQALLATRDPETKQPALSEVFLREELYHGPFADRAPDLILEPQRDNAVPAHNFVLDSSLKMDGAGSFGSSLPYSGSHTLEGILVAWGVDVARGHQIQDARIVDLAPTVLAALGVAVPGYMDGRVLSEIFSPERAWPHYAAHDVR